MRDEKFEKWWATFTYGLEPDDAIAGLIAKAAARAAWNARLSDEDLNGGDQLDAIRAHYRYRSDGDALAVERLLTHIDALKAHADAMAAALEQVFADDPEQYSCHGYVVDAYRKWRAEQ